MVVSDIRALAENDIKAALTNPVIWYTFAMHDIKQRYRRSIIGPFWYLLNNIIFISVLGVLYAQLFKQELNVFIPYMAVGYVTWQFMAASIAEGANVMVDASSLIKQVNIPISNHALRVVFRNFIIFLHNVPLLLVVPILMGMQLGWELMLLPFSFFILFVNGCWVCIVLGLLGARFRDVQPIMQNFVTIAFFFTPILWHADILADRAIFVNLNPLYHFVELVRMPLLGEMPKPVTLIVTFGISVAGIVTANVSISRFRTHLAYWV